MLDLRHIGLCQKALKIFTGHKVCSIRSKLDTDDLRTKPHKSYFKDFSNSSLFSHEWQSEMAAKPPNRKWAVVSPMLWPSVTKLGTLSQDTVPITRTNFQASTLNTLAPPLVQYLTCIYACKFFEVHAAYFAYNSVLHNVTITHIHLCATALNALAPPSV